MFGSVGAIVLRVVLTFFAVMLLDLPYLKLIGAAALLWIGVGLLKSDDGDENLEGHSNLAAAIKTIVVADLVMSLDNVIGVAAAAKGNVVLLIVGLVISIPLIIFGSAILLRIMGRFPIIITLGAGLLGWVAGEMAMSDPAISVWSAQQHTLHMLAPAAGALAVIALGKWLTQPQCGTCRTRRLKQGGQKWPRFSSPCSPTSRPRHRRRSKRARYGCTARKTQRCTC